MSFFERHAIAESSLASVRESFLPEDLLFVLIDDGSNSPLDLKLEHDHILIRKGQNYGISHSLSLGWDILHAMGVEYMTNLDSDVIVSRNWLSRLFQTLKSTDGEAIVTGFNGSYHKEKLATKDNLVEKESIGGINLFFERDMYKTVRKSLTTCDNVPSSLDEAIGCIGAYGKNPKLHKEMNGWDWGLMSLCAEKGLKTLCCKPSVVQHIGNVGMTSSPGRTEVARDFVDICVPRIIHQTWKDHDIPEHLRIMQDSVIKNNPKYTYMFWTDEDIKNFIDSEYNNITAFYKSLTYPIQNIDFARLLILYHFGGIYIDLDSMCYGGLDDLLGFPVSISNTEKHKAYSSHYPFVLNNAFMSAEKNNHFIKKVIHDVIGYEDPPDYLAYASFNPICTKILRSAGPLRVTESYMEYKYKSLVNILPSEYYHGVVMQKENTVKMVDDARSTQQQMPGCKLLHIHESSWWSSKGKSFTPRENANRCEIPESHKKLIKSEWS